ncbi:MAG: PQQ-binding-like beta-propeller repeat protein [Pirellulaceae bacterium]
MTILGLSSSSTQLVSIRTFFVFTFCSLGLVASGAFADAPWPCFLGPGGNPVVDTTLPTSFVPSTDEEEAGENVAWRIPLAGRSVSGPIVVDGKVITTGSSGIEGRWMHVVAADAASGRVLWERTTRSTGRPFCHPDSANAAPTPCTDGERVYAFYSSNDLVCYDLDGNLQWFRSLTDSHPLAGNDVGMSASPVVANGVVVVAVECQADSFAAGIDAKTGEVLWDISRPSSANWSSPRIVSGEGKSGVALLQSGRKLAAVDLSSGQSMWEKDIQCSTVATALVAEDSVFVPGRGVQALRLVSATQEPEVSWDSTQIRPNSSSLVKTSWGLIGLNRSILVCCDEQGEKLWNVRLKDAGTVWATPVVAGDHLYLFAMNGRCFTVKLNADQAEVVAVSEMGEDVLGTPAVAEGAMYVRSVDALWKIAAE